jgi:prepilin-type N-terminal cleavage/methylation domain-containing protein
MRVDKMIKKDGKVSTASDERGFSMIELMIVCVVLVIIAMIAIPNIAQIVNNYRLDAAGHSVASLLQQARTQAVQTNLPAYVNYSNSSVSGNMAFVVNSPSNTTYTAGNPDVALSSAVSFQAPPSSSGFHAQLDTYLGGGTPQVGGTIGFNARGLPCTAGVNPTVCSPWPAGFEWFMQSNAGWEAVTVTAAGRIKSWRLTSQSGGTYSWQ